MTRVADMPVLLVLRALGIGDLLTAVPALRALRRSFPEHRQVLACPPTLLPLVRLVGCVDEVIPTPSLDAPLARLVARAGITHVDVAVNLHGRGARSHHALLATRPRRLLAFAHADVAGHGAGSGHPRWAAAEHEVERWCRMLEAHGVAADPDDLDIGWSSSIPGTGATVIHPGAASCARRWPVARFAEVARREAAHGRTVVVTGSPEEAGLARELADRAGLPERAVLAGRVDLGGLARELAAAERIVCGDTGIAHLATALRVPSVVLFGPTPPAAWGPPARRRALHHVIWRGTVGDPHADTPDPGLLAIGVRDVLAALARLPGRDRGARFPLSSHRQEVRP